MDAGLLRLPFPGQESLRVTVLLTEPRCVALPTAHPLATVDSVPFEALWDEPFVAAPPETGTWRDYWLATDARDGQPAHIGAVTDQPDAWLSAIANGYGVALAPESAARFYTRPGITYRPVTGIRGRANRARRVSTDPIARPLSPSQVGIVWSPADDDNPVVQDFVRSCVDCVRPGPVP